MTIKDFQRIEAESVRSHEATRQALVAMADTLPPYTKDQLRGIDNQHNLPAMTQNEKRIAIAEKCGWTFHPPSYNEPPFSSQFKAEALLYWVRPGNMSHQLEVMPDYFGSLYAIHEAVETLTYEQAEIFDDELCDICKRANDLEENPAPWRFAVTNATAPQRCEAFGKALNLW